MRRNVGCSNEHMKKWAIICVVALAVGVLAISARHQLVRHARHIVLTHKMAQSAREHPDELSYAREFLNTAILQDTPPTDWIDSVSLRTDKTNYFYALKINFIECGTTLDDIQNGQIWVFRSESTNTQFFFYYQRHCPELQFNITLDEAGRKHTEAIFPLNNCTFDPDYNDDGKIDMKDVTLAKQKNN